MLRTDVILRLWLTRRQLLQMLGDEESVQAHFRVDARCAIQRSEYLRVLGIMDHILARLQAILSNTETKVDMYGLTLSPHSCFAACSKTLAACFR